MSTSACFVSDSATMLRRNLRHIQRYPSMTLMLVGMPVIFLLLFVYVFGGTLGAGLGGASGGRAEYVNYVTPGIVLMTVAGAAMGTAVSVAMDMTEGIVARFRTMAISRASVLTGHVSGSVIQTLLSMAVVIVVALLIGFRPTAGPVEWIAAGGVLTLFVVALTWLSVAFGLVSKSAEAASKAPATAAPAVPRQWIRPHRIDAGRTALVRRAPALHTRYRDAAQAPAWHPYRQQRDPRDRLVRWHHTGRLPLGEETIQSRSCTLAGVRRRGRRLMAAASRDHRPWGAVAIKRTLGAVAAGEAGTGDVGDVGELGGR